MRGEMYLAQAGTNVIFTTKGKGEKLRTGNNCEKRPPMNAERKYGERNISLFVDFTKKVFKMLVTIIC